MAQVCQDSSSAWTAQNQRPQIPQWKVAVASQGSSMGETAWQDHSRFRGSVWLICSNMVLPPGRSIRLWGDRGRLFGGRWQRWASGGAALRQAQDRPDSKVSARQRG